MLSSQRVVLPGQIYHNNFLKNVLTALLFGDLDLGCAKIHLIWDHREKLGSFQVLG